MIRKVTLLREFHPFADGESFEFKGITLLVGDQGAGKSTLLDLIIKHTRPILAGVNQRYDVVNGKIKATGKRGETFKDEARAIEQIIDLVFDGDDYSLIHIDTEKHNPRMGSGELTTEYKDAMIETLRDEALFKVIQTMDGFKYSADKDPSNKMHGVTPADIDKFYNRMTNHLLENVGLYFDSKRGGSIFGDEIKMDIVAAHAATMKSHGQSVFPMLEETIKNITGKVILIDEPETALSIRSQYKMRELIAKLVPQNQVIIATHSPILMELSVNVLSLEHRKWMETKEFLETQKQY